MELQAALEGRRSVRKFRNTPVSPEVLAQLADAAAYAPSWKNSQVTRYYAVSDAALRQKIVESEPDFNKASCQAAAVLVVVTTVRSRSGYNRDGSFATPQEKGWQMFDCGLSCMAFTLKAHEMGLGSVVLGYFDVAVITELLQIPEMEEVSALIALGYPDEAPNMPKRKMSDQILKVF